MQSSFGNETFAQLGSEPCGNSLYVPIYDIEKKGGKKKIDNNGDQNKRYCPEISSGKDIVFH